MNKRYIIRSLFIGLALGVLNHPASAQTTVSSKRDSSAASNANAPKKEPGRLFDVSKERSTAAVSVVAGDTLYKTPAPNITNTLYGRLPGLTVLQGNGEPGNDYANMGIRGIGSLAAGTSGYNTYKVFVDGFETTLAYFSYITPAEIESISILKDAAALSTFGLRGANGVIYVTTKRGKISKASVQFQARTGFQSALNINKPLNSYNYANLYNQAISNDNGNVWTPKYSASQLQAYANGTGTNVDWYDAVLKNRTPYTDGDLIFSGGDSTVRYNVTLDYSNQKALYDVSNSDITSNQTFGRYNLRSNLTFNMFKIFEARVDLNGRIEDRKQPDYPYNTAYGTLGSSLWKDLASYPDNIYPVKDAAGHWSGTTLYPNNPVASLNALGVQSLHTRYLQGNFGLKENLSGITKGLYLDEAFSFNNSAQSVYNKYSDYARYYNGVTTTTNTTTPIVASTLMANQNIDVKQGTVTLGYDRQFGDHRITSAVNYQQYAYRTDDFNSFEYHYQNISGRGNYSYKNKYIGELGFSYFGADAYAPGHRWGLYPAISGAWIVSNEAFLQNNKTVSYFKLRASAGRTGSSDNDMSNFGFGTLNGRYLYQQYYQSNASGVYFGSTGPSAQTTLNPRYIANADVKPEISMKYNIGADLKFFKKLDVSIDAFLDKRSNILTLNNTLPSDFGYNNGTTLAVFQNIGKMTNKGFEVSMNYTDHFGKVGYSINGQASYNKNKVDYMAEVTPNYAYNGATGLPYGTFRGLKSTGFYQQSDFNTDGTLKAGQPIPAFGLVQPGDLKYQDVNGDGKVDQNDVTKIGKSPFPELTYAFGASVNFKGFDLGALFQGVSGYSVNLLNTNLTSQTVAFINNGNAYQIAQGAWAYYPEQGIDTRATATYPRLTTVGNINNYGTASSFWIKSGDYLRIRNVELGYNFPAALIKKWGLGKLRAYVNAMNPVTWSSLLKDYHIDPETTYGYTGLKSYNIGVIVGF
ncbi:SusC/RagA family TonB-linked outer membrane protein [Mucilaginibacter jinjuensis]|uniref:SusC/RagA family TonB-linked outer membrane protein n=1 Tax=Mucilaginibacter jinjuensis TaxID=1176721 RepID=A0ABY7TFK5_9SPHI|nr:SusC/RagA family TonB-linked outer membrane protein [Mucilaginibacter jinjuensis]WCT14856.1 SusC/RagA family TonB-linked outer membrane protein [Mucilaginibacter jinjuensis]